jgi:hypothetical protein
VRGDLIRILSKLAKRRNKFDHVLIETTGELVGAQAFRALYPACLWVLYWHYAGSKATVALEV